MAEIGLAKRHPKHLTNPIVEHHALLDRQPDPLGELVPTSEVGVFLSVLPLVEPDLVSEGSDCFIGQLPTSLLPRTLSHEHRSRTVVRGVIQELPERSLRDAGAQTQEPGRPLQTLLRRRPRTDRLPRHIE